MRKSLRMRFTLAALAFLFMMLCAMPVMAAGSWKQVYTRFPATAGETLATGNVVCISGSDGKAYKADANDSALRPAVGIVGKGGATGATVEIVVSGVLAGQTAVTPGLRVFLSETAGTLTTTGPTNAQPVGFVMPGSAGATTSTTYFINVVPPSSNGAGY